MLVQFRCLRKEREHIFTRMVLVISHVTVYRPIVYVHIEEVHIHRNLDALLLEILVFEHLVYDHHLSVSYRCEYIVALHCSSVRHSEEKQRKAHHKDRQDTKWI